MIPTHTLNLWCDPKSGRYCAIAYFPDSRESIRRSLKTTSKAVADAALPEWAEKILPSILAERSGAASGESPETVEDVLAWYIETHLPSQRAAEKTILGYKTYGGKLAKYMESRGVASPLAITSRLIQEWATSDDMIGRNGLLAARKMLGDYARIHPREEMPVIEWDIPKRKRSRRYGALSSADLAKFLQRLESTDSPLYPLAAWVACTGWRLGDVLALRWSEVKEEYIDRDQLKTDNQLLFPITTKMRTLLDAAPRDVPCPFYMHKHTFYRQMHRFCDAEGFPRYTMRDLRVTFATRLADEGCPMHSLAELLGHSDPTMAAKYYVRLKAETIRDWAEKG